MFHEGGLQSGIGLAIQQGKPVACFVRDDSAESDTWQDEWLQHDQLPALLTERAIVLRIQTGSQEEGFLAAFCPIAKVPSLVIIFNGKLVENIAGGVSQEEFTTRVSGALTTSSNSVPAAESSAIAGSSQTSVPVPAPVSSAIQPPADASPAAPPSAASARVQQLLIERARRLDAERQLQEEQKAAERAAKAKARQDAIDQGRNLADDLPVSKQAREAAQVARKRKADERAELNRVLATIEADKAERKARAEERKRLAEERQQKEVDDEQGSTNKEKSRANGREVKLQVRLFDGTTLRSSFPPSASLNGDVRSWVDEHMKGTNPPPYNFKHILAPLPNRTIEMSEEAASLENLDLFPTATLVLVPIQGYTDAYSNSNHGGVTGLVYGGISGAYGLVSGGVGMVSGVLKSITGYGQEAPAAPSQPSGSSERPTGRSLERPTERQPRDKSVTSIRVRTLADQRTEGSRDRKEEWYNGNQTNFEPNKDDPDGK